MRMRWGHRACVTWMMAGGLLGCGPLVLPEGATETDASSEDTGTLPPPPSSGTTTAPPPGTTTSPPPPSTTTSPPPSDESTSGEPQTSAIFLDGFDWGHDWNECDIWAQDCPRGEKCMPWANDGGGSWNALRCSPIAEDPGAPGEPCTVEGSGTSGIDSCELGAMCWDVDPETNEGYCVAFCVGSPESPMCEDPGSSCVLGGDTVLALCLPNCHPLQQDCLAGEACLPVADELVCVVDASGELGAPGDQCEFINACDPGTFCAAAEAVPDCGGAAGCCTSFCDLDVMPPVVCLPGQECVPWYEEGQAPPGHEDLGACALPA